MRGTVAFIVKGYPRLSETFIAQEIRALEARGLAIDIVSLRHPTDPFTHPVHAEIGAPVTYLPEYLWRQPARVWRAWRAARRLPGYRAARRVWLRDLARDPTPNRARRFGQALVLAHELGSAVVHLHAHFLHTPASVARYASLLTGLPWSVSAHAKDIWTSPDWDKAEKLASCAWAVTCSAVNRDHLAALAPAGRVALAYHGLDLERFSPAPSDRPPRDGSGDPVVILSVGRAVEKKGFDDAIAALAALPAGLSWRYVHVGGGPLLGALKRQAAARGLDGRVTWLGAQPQAEVLAQYRAADVFVLPCRIAGDGDRDGLPNVLLEAQSQSLAVISTVVSAVPELVVHGTTGHLVPPDDVGALTHALDSLITDPVLRIRYGAAGAQRVTEAFSHLAVIGNLAALLGLDPPAAAGTLRSTGKLSCASPSTHP
ncbi:MAG: glycosyltransferase family 4 protein [Proteobacteria bacterium]|nr:glycosyltransferase family 4 protein [Pseudomonadota bacterium]